MVVPTLTDFDVLYLYDYLILCHDFQVTLQICPFVFGARKALKLCCKGGQDNKEEVRVSGVCMCR